MTTVDFAQINAAASDPFPIADSTNMVAGLDGDIYLAHSNGWLSKLNPTTHSFDDFLHLTPVSGRSSLQLSAMCAKSGALWVAGRSSVGGTDLAIYRVMPDGTADKHAVWDTANAIRNILAIKEDPVENLLYFVTDNLPTTGAYGIVRYDIDAGTFAVIIDADQMVVWVTRAVTHGPGYQIRDVAVRSDQSIVFVANQRNDTNDPDAALHYGRSLMAWNDGGKPPPNTTEVNVVYYEEGGRGVPIDHSGTIYCVPHTVTVGPDDNAYFTWQQTSVTG